MGSLVQSSEDASGLMYRRNRYYDPKTGRFTQEDPIGLAGGLNTYGFADGDPVSYTDPYGLAAEECCQLLRNLASFGTGFVPIASEVNDVTTILTGRDVIAGEDVGIGGRFFAAAGIISPVGGGAQVRGAVRGVAEAAQSLSKAIGRNSVTIHTVNGHRRIDLVGKAHGGVATPHVHTHSRHVNPRTGQSSKSRDSRQATAATMADVRQARNAAQRQGLLDDK
jgi:RHS repeat-associated protein